MAEPTELRPQPSTKMVSMLTELLGRAKRGEIEQMALVVLDANDPRDGYSVWISDCATDRPSTLRLIGAISDLQFTALTIHNERQ